jgi:hypothetical protein
MRYFNNRDMQETILIKKFDPGSWGPGRSVGLAIGQLENHFGTVLHEARGRIVFWSVPNWELLSMPFEGTRCDFSREQKRLRDRLSPQAGIQWSGFRSVQLNLPAGERVPERRRH